MKLLLQHKILLGYIILIAVIGSMAAIMFYERSRVHKIENEITEIREANQTINAAHRHITILTTLGESAIIWDDEDYRKYQLRRQKVDSLLQILQRDYGEFISFNRIDTFRILLANKEEHLFHTMKIHQRQDSLLLEQLPIVTEQATSFRTVTRKKKGIAGFFGAKETVQVPMQSNPLHALNRQLISRQQQISENTDSLRVQNKELNSKLSTLLQELDEQSQTVFQNKEQHIKESYERSAVIVTILIICAIVLLMVSYWIIQRDIRAKERAKKEQEELIGELLDRMRMQNYDLLVTDMKMPDMNGYEVLELLRSSEIGNSQSIPVIVATALDKSSEAELLAGGFCGCLFKPFSAKELLETISHSAAHKTQEQDINLSPLLAFCSLPGELTVYISMIFRNNPNGIIAYVILIIYADYRIQA